MFTVEFTQAARRELIRAQDWYEDESIGLSKRFRREIDSLVERMAANPRQFPVVFKNARRALVRRFPYALFFVLKDDRMTVIACFHASRDPIHWQSRARAD